MSEWREEQVNWNKFFLNSNLTNNQLMFTTPHGRHRSASVAAAMWTTFVSSALTVENVWHASRKFRILVLKGRKFVKLKNVHILLVSLQLTFEWNTDTLWLHFSISFLARFSVSFYVKAHRASVHGHKKVILKKEMKWSNKNLSSSRSDGKNCQFLSPFWQSKAALRSRAQAFDMFFPHFLDTILNVFPPFSVTPEIHCVCLCVPYRQIEKH